MKLLTSIGAGVLTSALLVGSAFSASETAQNFQIKNRFRVGWDSNVYEAEQDEQDSFKIIEELEFLLNMDMEQTFFGLRYRPTFVYWSDRDPDDTDFHHEADVVFAHNFSPRLSLNIKETLRIAELPELIDRGSIAREKDDYTYNLLDGVLGYRLSDPTRVELGARYTVLRYDNSEVADTDDYDIIAAGVTLRHQLNPDTALSGDVRLEQTEYKDLDTRSSESLFAGVGLEQIFSPNLVGTLRGGVQNKTFDDSHIGDETSPFGDISLTYLPSPKTRITGGVGYSLFEADVYPFASQDRLLSYVTLSHDLTARIQLFLAGSYQNSKYHAKQALDDSNYAKMDGDEDVLQGSARLSYMLNRKNYLEASVQYMDFASDLRSDFDRTRVELGWRTQL
ncbi:MAG: outer membrane beta-barrel protein [Kiritimatiellae bacterium]|nr:outer membrane beta-barrel protein [Kiritimatiellia bacterium]MCO5061509.1 outer membrane beta-barrel protein [Kiritimatiellia bacterium]MCO6401515.1 outer membrane beta-barrel protein [Verrucomicrobiota bacterium]